MKRLIAVVLVLVAIGSAWLIYSRASRSRSETLPEGIATAPVQRGTFEATVSATGKVSAEFTQRLVFQTSGQVIDVLVKEGDTVHAGQVLVRLDAADLELALKQAEAALAVAEAQLKRTIAGPSAEEIAAAEAALLIAKAGEKTAQAAVAAAQANLRRVQAGASAEEIAIAQRRVEEAKNALWGAQAQRDAICGRTGLMASQADCDQAQASVQRAEEGVRIAELQLQQLQSGARPEDIAGAKAQLDQALGQLESARAQVLRAEADLARVKRGASAEEIAIAQAQVEQARVNVEIARHRLEQTELKAPSAGRVASINVLVGDTVTPGTPVVTLVDTERFYILVGVDETQIGQVQEGQSVRVTLDAYPGREFLGRVANVSLVGADVQGIVVYDVRVDLEPTDVIIRPQMTASVDIVVARHEDALLIPNRALRRDAQGRYVEVLEGNTLKRVPVEIGGSNIEFTEVLSGLEEGQQVVVSRPRTNLFEFSLGGN